MGHAGGTGLKEPPTLLILPCSKRKNPPKSPVVSLGSRTVLDVLQRTASQLQQGRRGCAASVDWSSAEFAALDYYDGHLYRVSYLREKLARELTSGNVGTLILSGAYGVVLAEERIHKYDRHMDAGYWLRLRLNEVIGEFVEQTASQRVYIFLAAKSPLREDYRTSELGPTQGYASSARGDVRYRKLGRLERGPANRSSAVGRGDSGAPEWPPSNRGEQTACLSHSLAKYHSRNRLIQANPAPLSRGLEELNPLGIGWATLSRHLGEGIKRRSANRVWFERDGNQLDPMCFVRGAT